MCIQTNTPPYLPPPHDPLLLGARVLGLPEHVGLGAQRLLGRPQRTLCGVESFVVRCTLWMSICRLWMMRHCAVLCPLPSIIDVCAPFLSSHLRLPVAPLQLLVLRARRDLNFPKSVYILILAHTYTQSKSHTNPRNPKPKRTWALSRCTTLRSRVASTRDRRCASCSSRTTAVDGVKRCWCCWWCCCCWGCWRSWSLYVCVCVLGGGGASGLRHPSRLLTGVMFTHTRAHRSAAFSSRARCRASASSSASPTALCIYNVHPHHVTQ